MGRLIQLGRSICLKVEIICGRRAKIERVESVFVRSMDAGAPEAADPNTKKAPLLAKQGLFSAMRDGVVNASKGWTASTSVVGPLSTRTVRKP